MGDLRLANRIMAIFAVGNDVLYSDVASILMVHEDSVALWVKNFLLKGVDGLKARKASGRPPKLTKTEKQELDQIITEGPEKAGFPGACWRSPMIQKLILDKFKVQYSVVYFAQLLKNMGFRFKRLPRTRPGTRWVYHANPP